VTQFRPCIDLHQGKVKQIVGGSLDEKGATTNFISEYNAHHYAHIYRENNLLGGHVIALGKGNDEEVMNALKTWPGHLQFGGGVNLDNAQKYLDAGASHVIVTSYLFEEEIFSWSRLQALSEKIGKDRLVLDLSCRRVKGEWYIATNRWQTITTTQVDKETLEKLSGYCSEFLIHAADVEGLQCGIDEELVTLLGQCALFPVTYAGGAKGLDDLDLVKKLSHGRVDLTIGSALDIFGGEGVTLTQCIQWNKLNR
jgi:phosphoribosylformimino-5-aminoimidazole carboxamide ribotide isomerase